MASAEPRAEVKEFMQDQVRVPGFPKPAHPDGLRVCMWAGVAAGIGCGAIMRFIHPEPYSTREVMYIRLLGDLWLSAMRALALPVFLFTMMLSVYDLSVIACMHLVWQLLLALVLLRVWIGVQSALVSSMVNAGASTNPDRTPSDAIRVGDIPARNTPGQAILDLCRSTFAENPVEALIQYSRTTFKPPNGTNKGEGDVFTYTKGDSVPIPQANLLGLVLWGTAVGVAVVLLRKHVQTIILFVRVVGDVTANLVEWLYLVALPFVMLCAAADVAGAWEISSQFSKMKAFLLTIIVQLVIQMLVLYPLVTAVTAGWRGKRVFAPWYLLWFTSEALIVAGVSSSAHVAYPLMLRAIRRVQGIDSDAAAFVLSVLSVWLNDGTAIYLTTAGTWLAQDQKTYIIKKTNGYIVASVLSAFGSVSAAGETRLIAPLTVLVGATMQADTTSVTMAPMMHWDWLLYGCVSAVNISGAFFFAIILGYYALRRKLRRMLQGKPVNHPVLRPRLRAVLDYRDSIMKPLDEDIYPPAEDDPELDDLKDNLQVKQENRRAARADKSANKKAAKVAKAREQAKAAESAAEDTEYEIEEQEKKER